MQPPNLVVLTANEEAALYNLQNAHDAVVAARTQFTRAGNASTVMDMVNVQVSIGTLILAQQLFDSCFATASDVNTSREVSLPPHQLEWVLSAKITVAYEKNVATIKAVINKQI